MKFLYTKDDTLFGTFNERDVSVVKDKLNDANMSTDELAERCLMSENVTDRFFSEGSIRPHQFERIMRCLDIECEVISKRKY